MAVPSNAVRKGHDRSGGAGGSLQSERELATSNCDAAVAVLVVAFPRVNSIEVLEVASSLNAFVCEIWHHRYEYLSLVSVCVHRLTH